MFTGAPSLLAAAGGVNLTAYAPLLVPIATALTGWLAYLGIKRAARVEDSQQQAKNKLDQRAQGFDELSKLNERLEAENARLRISRDDESARVRGDVERQAVAHRAAEERCHRQIERLLREMDTLRSVVTSEIARAAAVGAAVDAAHHVEEHDPHDGQAVD